MPRITDLTALTVRLPLPQPVATSNLVITERDFVLVDVVVDGELRGTGFGFSRGGLVAETIEQNLKPLLIGGDPFLSEQLWQEMYQKTRYLGRKGLLMRAISAVDIALWDARAKLLNAPLWQLLGGFRRDLPVYVAGGYYRQDATIASLEHEFAGYREAGYRGAKLNLGGAPLAEDIQRVAAVRAVVGDDFALAVDFNGSLRTAKRARAYLEGLEPYGLAFIEEPFLMDNLPALRELYRHARVPIAVGEDESGRWAFRELLAPRALDLLRHDATLVGGVSEWLKVAHLGLAFNVELFPHWFPEIHLHLALSMPDCWGIEVIDPASGIMNFHQLLHNPVTAEDGMAKAPDEPGLGLSWNREVIRRHTVT
ncbi:MAG: mandelate racemase/muconate lactonizing enzyme family protein [Trueperaceae bacterium]|nr:MAG: mandelate racemase/muconate lactonizing enzyme family protein [Trueperaceae bacterium]